jgi:hypothetical protein
MTTEEKLAELERRVTELEARPAIWLLPSYPMVVPMPQPYPVPAPYCPPPTPWWETTTSVCESPAVGCLSMIA